MTEFKFEKCVVRIHGSAPEDLKTSTEKFMKKVIRCRRCQKQKEKLKTSC